MPKLTVHLYGPVPAKFMDLDLEFDGAFYLEMVERRLFEMYGDMIPKDYRTEDDLFNHQLVISGDAKGKRVGYDEKDISHLDAIWFVVPVGGG